MRRPGRLPEPGRHQRPAGEGPGRAASGAPASSRARARAGSGATRPARGLGPTLGPAGASGEQPGDGGRGGRAGEHVGRPQLAGQECRPLVRSGSRTSTRASGAMPVSARSRSSSGRRGRRARSISTIGQAARPGRPRGRPSTASRPPGPARRPAGAAVAGPRSRSARGSPATGSPTAYRPLLESSAFAPFDHRKAARHGVAPNNPCRCSTTAPRSAARAAVSTTAAPGAARFACMRRPGRVKSSVTSGPAVDDRFARRRPIPTREPERSVTAMAEADYYETLGVAPRRDARGDQEGVPGAVRVRAGWLTCCWSFGEEIENLQGAASRDGRRGLRRRRGRPGGGTCGARRHGGRRRCRRNRCSRWRGGRGDGGRGARG